MKSLSRIVWATAIFLLAGEATQVAAGWQNVFQVSCFRRRQRVATSYYFAPAPVQVCDPAPQPVVTTNYIQRSYYQPVTTYQSRSYYEPVTTYQTSYYWEPVKSYQYTSYYDPSSCGYTQVAVPTTSYYLRSKTSAVQSWVQRCASVPVTTYQQAYYWEPVTTVPAAVVAPMNLTSPPPLSAAPPGVTVTPGKSSDSAIPDQRYYPPPDTMPSATGNNYRQSSPREAAPTRQRTPASAEVRMDRIVSLPAGQVEGQVRRPDDSLWAGARLIFVNSDRQQPRQTTQTNDRGEFRVSLAGGTWLVYLQGEDGKPVFHRRLDVQGSPKELPSSLVSR